MAVVDTVTPILVDDYRKEIGPKLWHYDQIYLGPDITKYDNQSISRRYVPVAGDIVFSPSTGDWIVTEVSQNYIPILVPRNVHTNDTDVSDSIIIPSSMYSRRCDVIYVDNTVTPIRYYVNPRVYINGSHATHYKIFLGNNISSNGNSLIAVYNNYNQIVSDSMDLELAAFATAATNQSIKTPKTGYLKELPSEGDIVTLVIFANDGTELDTIPLVVAYENFVVASGTTRTITNIQLDSPYISSNDSSVVEIPRNMNINALALFGIVNYNDGQSPLRLPVNGNKFSLLGADAYTASVDMSSVGVVLSYALGDDESAVGTTGNNIRAITKNYRIKTLPSDAAYSVKLFVIPFWNKQLAKWNLQYVLYDLRRDMHQNVTSLVELDDDYKFNPDLFAQRQTVQVAINLMNVGPQYKFYRPVQSFYITLIKTGEVQNADSYYNLAYSTDVILGPSLVANRRVLGANTTIDLSCGLTTVDDYIAKIYNKIEVIYTSDSAAPPRPSGFRLRKLGSDTFVTLDISQITSMNQTSETWTQGDTAVVEFISISAGVEVELGTLAYPVNIVS